MRGKKNLNELTEHEFQEQKEKCSNLPVFTSFCGRSKTNCVIMFLPLSSPDEFEDSDALK